MQCPKCRGSARTKNGTIKENQHYKCKECGCNYTFSSLSRTPIETRLKCIRHYLARFAPPSRGQAAENLLLF